MATFSPREYRPFSLFHSGSRLLINIRMERKLLTYWVKVLSTVEHECWPWRFPIQPTEIPLACHSWVTWVLEFQPRLTPIHKFAGVMKLSEYCFSIIHSQYVLSWTNTTKFISPTCLTLCMLIPFWYQPKEKEIKACVPGFYSKWILFLTWLDTSPSTQSIVFFVVGPQFPSVKSNYWWLCGEVRASVLG